ncbi:MAG: prenyltransferase/squalene oxidase repeat-containing protein [Isosphaeraceae bacterium]
MAKVQPVGSLRQAIRHRWERLGRGEIDPETLRSVPSWGLSVLLHLLLLVILAVVLHWSRGGGGPETIISGELIDTQLGDVESLVDAKQAGDPFTNEKAPDPPSIGIDPDPMLKLSGQPEMRSLEQFTPSFASPTPLTDIKNATMIAMKFPEMGTRITAPFSGRQGMTRAKLVRREGGTARSEKSVEDGLDWIVRHQRPDGSWSLNYHEQCQGVPCPHSGAMESDTAATGLALLPLLGAGYIHTVKSRHQDAVRRGIAWLVDHQQEDGNLFIGPPGMAWMYSHGIATMVLCEAYGLSQDPRLKRPSQRAVKFIVEAQDRGSGGWRYSPGASGDTSVFGWQIFALRSAHGSGIVVPKNALKLCSRYLDQAAVDRSRTTYSYQPGRGGASPVMTAEALVGRQILGWERNYPPLVKGASQIAQDLETREGRNIYYWYYATQLLHNMKNKDWEKWNPKVREALIDLQCKDGTCANGSWDPYTPVADAWGKPGGRMFTTSLSILTLEVYYRYLPLYRDYDEDQEKDDPLFKEERKGGKRAAAEGS